MTKTFFEKSAESLEGMLGGCLHTMRNLEACRRMKRAKNTCGSENVSVTTCIADQITRFTCERNVHAGEHSGVRAMPSLLRVCGACAHVAILPADQLPLALSFVCPNPCLRQTSRNCLRQRNLKTNTQRAINLKDAFHNHRGTS